MINIAISLTLDINRIRKKLHIRTFFKFFFMFAIEFENNMNQEVFLEIIFIEIIFVFISRLREVFKLN